MGCKCKKDVIWREQTEDSFENKGVSVARGQKPTAF
jgi:hypothetical protein